MSQDLSFIGVEKDLQSRLLVTRATCLIEVNGRPSGTGFLVGERTVLTCNHVVSMAQGDRTLASPVQGDETLVCRFGYYGKKSKEAHQASKAYQVCQVVLQSPWSQADEFHGGEGAESDRLNFALLELPEPVGLKRGYLVLPSADPALRPGDPLFIAQHAEGGPLVWAADGSLVQAIGESRLFYMASTRPGSSGSPVLDYEFRVVAIHAGAGSSKRFKFGVRAHLVRAAVEAASHGDKIGSETQHPQSILTQISDDHVNVVPRSSLVTNTRVVMPKVAIWSADEENEIANQLALALRPLVMGRRIQEPWVRANIQPGKSVPEEIRGNLDSADVVILLTSVNILSPQEGEWLAHLETLQKVGSKNIIPVLAKPIYLEGSLWFSRLQHLPKNSKGRVVPISKWSSLEDALDSIVKAIAGLIAPP